MTDVRYVPDLKRNLISLDEFDKKGYVFKGEQSILTVMKGSKEDLRGVKTHGLYTFMVEIVSGSTNVASMKPLSMNELWHKILGHVNERGLVKFSKQNLWVVTRSKTRVLGPCVFGKFSRMKFNKGKEYKTWIPWLHSY